MTLRELRVNDVAVVSDATLGLDSGFGVLTGETGAGKSVCITALRIALGGRAETDVIRPAATAARVAAVFQDVPASVTQRLVELGIPPDDLATLSREVPRSGRSTCRVNGALVSQAVLREIGDALVEVTAQGASQRLMRRAWQRDLLDSAGGDTTSAPRQRVADAVLAMRAADSALESARRASRSDAAALDRARALVADLGALELRAGEDSELAGECLMLRHAAAIVGAASALAGAAAGDETGAADIVAGGSVDAGALGGLDPALASLAERAVSLVDGLRELALDARRHAAGVSVDEGRLAEIEQRLDLLARVARRHGSIEEAIADLDGASELLAAAEGGEDAASRLEAGATAAREAVAQAASALGAARSAAARRLEQAVTAELRDLELPHARFRIILGRSPDPLGVDLGDGIPVRCGLHGVDDVDFRFAANRGMVPVPLDEGPSGGELSRISLALSAVVTEDAAPVLVLDEVDAGIGGETAARVGDVLAAIGENRQVLAVTHRAEIAARAGHHLVVSKRDDPGGAVASVAPVDGEPRVHEIARLMSGRATPAALDRAGELLDEGRDGSARPRARSATRTM